jgi:hypothetical protein
LTIGPTRVFLIAELVDQVSIGKLLQLSPLHYNGKKIYIKRPKGFLIKHFLEREVEVKDGKVILKDQEKNFKICLENVP